jgi:hypothetical protein
MASSPVPPLCQIPLHPFIDTWSGGPGRTFTVIRFGVWASLLRLPPEGDEPAIGPIVLAMLQPEMPFAVLPVYLRESRQVLCDRTVGDSWQGPLPVWRGIPCQIASVTVRFRNLLADPAPIELPLTVLLPDRDPAGPRQEQLFLGSRFLTHYGFRAVLEYSEFQYLEEDRPGNPRIDSRATCGFLELD